MAQNRVLVIILKLNANGLYFVIICTLFKKSAKKKPNMMLGFFLYFMFH